MHLVVRDRSKAGPYVKELKKGGASSSKIFKTVGMLDLNKSLMYTLNTRTKNKRKVVSI